MCYQFRQLHSVCGHVTKREIPCEVAASTPKKTPPEPWPPAVDTGSKMKDAFLTWCLKSLKPVATKTRPGSSTCRPPLSLLHEVEYGFCLKCRESYETYAANTLKKNSQDATRSADVVLAYQKYKNWLRWSIPVQAGRVPAEYVFRTQDSKSGRSAGAGLERQELVMLQQVTKIIGMNKGDGGSTSRLEKVKDMRRKTLEWAEEGDSARRRSERERKAEMKKIEVEKKREKERLQQERLERERVEKERLREEKIERKKRLEEERFEEERRSKKEKRLEIKKWLGKNKKLEIEKDQNVEKNPKKEEKEEKKLKSGKDKEKTMVGIEDNEGKTLIECESDDDSDDENAEEDRDKKNDKKDEKRNYKMKKVEKVEKVEKDKAEPSPEVLNNKESEGVKNQRTRESETKPRGLYIPLPQHGHTTDEKNSHNKKATPLSVSPSPKEKPVEGSSPLPRPSPKSSNGTTKSGEPKKKRRRVSWASPVLSRVKIIEAREVPEPKESQSKTEYRPPFVSENNSTERSVIEPPLQEGRSNPPSLTVEPPSSPRSPSIPQKEPWNPPSVTVEPPSSPRSPSLPQKEPWNPPSVTVDPPSSPRSPLPLQKEPSKYSSVTVEPPSSPRSSLLETSESSPPSSAFSAPRDSVNQHRTQTYSTAIPPVLLNRQGAIKVRNTPNSKISIPRLEPTPQPKTIPTRHVPHAVPRAQTNSPRLAQPQPVRPQNISFKERLAFFEGQLAPQGSSSNGTYTSGTPSSPALSFRTAKTHHQARRTVVGPSEASTAASFHTARTQQSDGSGSRGIPSDTSSTPSFYTARTHQSDSSGNPEQSVSATLSSSSSTKAQYSRSAYSERWEEFLAHGSLDLPSKYTGPGLRYRFCGCSSCVWAKTSEGKNEPIGGSWGLVEEEGRDGEREVVLAGRRRRGREKLVDWYLKRPDERHYVRDDAP